MKNICTINHNDEDRRITISWDESDGRLYAEDEQLDESAETLEEAYMLAGELWGAGQLPWELQIIEEEES